MMFDLEQFRRQLAENRRQFEEGGRLAPAQRRTRLRALRAALLGRRDLLVSALNADLGKSEFEALETEFLPVLWSLNYTLRHFRSWTRVRRVPVAALNWPARGVLRPEPFGQVLVVGAWNYPLLLALEPVIGAVAAGNRVVLKSAEACGATARALEALLAEIFPPEEVMVLGDEAGLPEVLNEHFDYIFFTGGEEMGRKVAAAAAAQLTPVTLELGGKSPAIVCADADLAVAARRIAWGKFLNAGQTCVAPDYVLVHHAVKDELLRELARAVHRFYGEAPLENPEYPRIVNPRHFERLLPLLAQGRLVTGGEHNREACKIAPTILDGIGLEDPVMEREIFGPILPVLEFTGLDEALAIVNRRPRPLALYCFTRNRRDRAKILEQTSSGGVVVNDVVMHLMNPAMPFGGVGASGYGHYHGRYTVETFTHYRPVLIRSNCFDLPFRYPPFAAWRTALLRWLSRN